MNKSESIKEIATALCKAQAEMSGAKKGAANPFFKSKYADLGAVVEAVKGPFADNGLSYSQFPIFEDGKVGVETILMHESGEWMSSVLILPMTKQDPQAAGSAITYARRYALQSIAGIPAEDDDGNSASAKQNGPGKKAISPEAIELERLYKLNEPSGVVNYYNSLDQAKRNHAWPEIGTQVQSLISVALKG